MYKSATAICDGTVTFGIDQVYASSALGNQTTISDFLNSKMKDLDSVSHNEDCVKQVFRVLCHFYLPPCGNTTHPAPPSSICQEECQMVQEYCSDMWNSALLALNTINHAIECNNTSTLLFPVPHCCTGAGLGLFYNVTFFISCFIS